jgi:hypothetical protein
VLGVRCRFYVNNEHPKGLFGKWRIQVDGRGLKGILEILTYSGNSSTPMPFIPLHSTNSETSPKVKICPQILRPLTPYNYENRKSHASTSRTRSTRKPPKSKAFLQDLRGKITRKKDTPTSCMIPKTNPAKKHLQNLPTRIPRKGSKNHRKRQKGKTQSSLEEPRRITYTYHEGSYKV